MLKKEQEIKIAKFFITNNKEDNFLTFYDQENQFFGYFYQDKGKRFIKIQKKLILSSIIKIKKLKIQTQSEPNPDKDDSDILETDSDPEINEN